MHAISFHFGYHSCPGHLPIGANFIDLWRHDEGVSLWVGPLGIIVYSDRLAVKPKPLTEGERERVEQFKAALRTSHAPLDIAAE